MAAVTSRLLHQEFSEETRPEDCGIVLISGDGDFTATMRHARQAEFVIRTLVISHGQNCDQNLRNEAQTWMDWHDLFKLEWTAEEHNENRIEIMAMAGDPVAQMEYWGC